MPQHQTSMQAMQLPILSIRRLPLHPNIFDSAIDFSYYGFCCSVRFDSAFVGVQCVVARQLLVMVIMNAGEC